MRPGIRSFLIPEYFFAVLGGKVQADNKTKLLSRAFIRDFKVAGDDALEAFRTVLLHSSLSTESSTFRALQRG